MHELDSLFISVHICLLPCVLLPLKFVHATLSVPAMQVHFLFEGTFGFAVLANFSCGQYFGNFNLELRYLLQTCGTGFSLRFGRQNNPYINVSLTFSDHS